MAGKVDPIREQASNGVNITALAKLARFVFPTSYPITLRLREQNYDIS